MGEDPFSFKGEEVMTFAITVLDYGAGNIASLLNSLSHLGYENIIVAQEAADILDAKVRRVSSTL
jgi:hypothetical protein